MPRRGGASGRRLRAQRFNRAKVPLKPHLLEDDDDMECLNCGSEFDPIATRWKCPHCKYKADCCDGAPLPIDAARPAKHTLTEEPAA